ncbi:MAG: hypothetical protein ACRC8S_03290 [Fimbriiglobus sp.]
MDTATLRLAAWHRAQGDSWDLIAAKLEIAVRTIEILPVIHFTEWQQAMIDFAPLVAQETLFAAQASLRLQTQSANEKIAQTASVAALKHDIEEKKLIAKREALLAKAKKPSENELTAEIPSETPIAETPVAEALPQAPIAETETETPIAETPTPPEASSVVSEEPEIDLVGQIDWNSLPKPPKPSQGPKKLTSFLGGK